MNTVYVPTSNPSNSNNPLPSASNLMVFSLPLTVTVTFPVAPGVTDTLTVATSLKRIVLAVTLI